MKNAIVLMLLLCASTLLYSQADSIDDASKINSVIGVASVILLGIAFFLFYLERRLKKLEDKLNL